MYDVLHQLYPMHRLKRHEEMTEMLKVIEWLPARLVQLLLQTNFEAFLFNVARKTDWPPKLMHAVTQV